MSEEEEKKIQDIMSRYLKGDNRAAKEIASFSEDENRNFMNYFTMSFLLTESAKYRGKVIDITIFLEMVISKILSKYFTTGNETKENLINSFVFDRMMMNTKFSLFKRILKTCHTKIWEKHSKDIKEIDGLIEFRNNLAHSLLNTSEDHLSAVMRKRSAYMSGDPSSNLEEIELLYFKENNFEKQVVKKSQIDDYYIKCYSKIALIQQIGDEMMNI